MCQDNFSEETPVVLFLQATTSYKQSLSLHILLQK